jgi:fucose 4-O-acetylase-like acetyltransferase
MQHVTNFPVQTKAQTAEKANTKVSTNSRFAYIDMAKVVLIILVVMLHTAITYGASGDWTYIDPTANEEISDVLLSLFVIYIQSFSMSLFFFFSGYFTPASFDKKGTTRFWRDRFVHLAIPMIVYTFVLSRIPNYLREVANNRIGESFWSYSIRTFASQADGGPTWFIFALLIFSIGYTLLRLAVRWLHLEKQSWTLRLVAPTNKSLLIAVLILAAAMFIVGQFNPIGNAVKAFGIYSMMLAFFPFYIAFFTAGVLAYRNDWLSKLPRNMLKLWGWISLGLVIVLPVFMIAAGAMEIGMDPFLSGFTWRCALTSLWMAATCVAFSVTLTIWLREKVKNNSRMAAMTGPNSFGVYLIHPIILVAVCVFISTLLLHPLIKFVVATLISVPVCFILAAVIRRIPVIKRVL